MKRQFLFGYLIFFAIAFSSDAHAEIIGFNNLIGWTYNQPDGGTPADLPNANSIHLTTGNAQRRSVFYNTPQDISQFSASFTYRATNFNASLVGQGIGFVIQNSPSGASAIGGGNGGLGYSGISNSATTIIWGDTGGAQTYNGYFTNGSLGSGSNVISPANAFGGRELGVNVVYNNPILTVSIDDPLFATTGPEFTRNYVVGNLATTIGASSAYIGFTASTGDSFGNGGSNQYISNFQYLTQSVPEPTALSMVGIACISLTRLRAKRFTIRPS